MTKNTKLFKESLPLPTIHTVTSDYVDMGIPIPPIERVKLFSPLQWEEFVLEWADSLREIYHSIERIGGAGDMGIDILCICTPNNREWDNYQCKHYDHPLSPSDIWTEIGKLIYYSREGEYNYPRRYIFVSPQGAGTKLSNLLKKTREAEIGIYFTLEHLLSHKKSLQQQ